MKKGILIVFVALVALLFLGCGSAPKVSDKSVSLEQSSTMRIFNLQVRQFDEKSVIWGVMMGEKQIVISAGAHTLKLFNRFEDNMSIPRKWIETTATVAQEFIPGHTYVVTFETDLLLKPIRPIIFDATLLQSELIPDTSSPAATALEGRWVETNGKQEILFCGDQYIFKDTEGKYIYRGYFTLDGKTVRCFNGARFTKGKWNISMMTLFALNDFTYNGTTLKDKKFEYKKVE